MADEENARPIDRAFLTDDPEAGTLLLVRHGQQEWPDPETATVGEWVDPPLSELGLQQAAAVARYLASDPITAVYSSELKRAFVTGQSIAEAKQAPHETIAELEEIRLYGDLPHDQRPVEILGEKLLAGARERFVRTKKWDSYPHSETSESFRRRACLGVEAAIADHPGETVVIACHGGVINAYVASILDVQEDMFYRPAHASVHRVRFKDSQRVIETLNELTFLKDQDMLSV